MTNLKIEQVSKETNVPFGESFIPAVIMCWHCKKDILVFTWKGRGLFPQEEPKIKPYPRTIQKRFSKQWGGEYWANTCPMCKSIQGDNYLFLFPDAPFKS